MISNAVSVRRRMPLAPRLSLVFALGAAIAWQPALAGVSQDETGQSLSGSPSIVLPGAASGAQGSLTGSANATKAPIVVADNNLKISGDNKNKKKNNNNNSNNNGKNNNNKNNNNWTKYNKNNNNWNKNNDWDKNNKYNNKYVTKKIYVQPTKKIYVKPWNNKNYYGQFFGGVVLGSILTAAAVGVAPPPPAPELCWYWSDPYRSRGYWDYCPGYPY